MGYCVLSGELCFLSRGEALAADDTELNSLNINPEFYALLLYQFARWIAVSRSSSHLIIGSVNGYVWSKCQGECALSSSSEQW